jgi:hypothetical protein
VCWIDNTGLLRIGHNGTGTMGYTVPSGRKIVVGNVFLCNCLQAARNAVVIPNSTITARYTLSTAGGNAILDKCNVEWYANLSRAYGASLNNTGVIDNINLNQIATEMNWTNVGVGNKPTVALTVSPLIMTLCSEGGTFTDCVWTRVAMANGNHTNTLTDISGFNFVNNRLQCNTIRSNATSYAVIATRIANCTWTNTELIQGEFRFTDSKDCIVTNTSFTSCVSGSTITTYASYVFSVLSLTTNMIFEGLTYPTIGSDQGQPYTAIFSVGVASCADITMKNIGTPATPLSTGTANITGYAATFAANSFAENIKIQRVYTGDMRTGFINAPPENKGVRCYNCGSTYAEIILTIASADSEIRGQIGSISTSIQAYTYGTTFTDCFTSATAGKVVLYPSDPSPATAAYATKSAGVFNLNGAMVMQGIGLSCSFETPYFILGHTGFSNTPITTSANLTDGDMAYQYQIDKNDGNGMSAISAQYSTKATFGTALSTITGIDPALGFKLKLTFTTLAGTPSLSQVAMYTTSSAAAQLNLYPLDLTTFSLTGLVTGSDVTILEAGTETVLASSEDIGGTSFSYQYATLQAIDVAIYKPGYIPAYIRNYSLTASNVSLPIAQTADPSYLV